MSETRDHDPDIGEPRRGFFVKFLAGAIGMVTGLVPAAFGTLFFLDPLLRKKKLAGSAKQDPNGVEKDAEGFINLKIVADSLPDDGAPLAVKVFDDKVDAWNMYRNVEIGNVWLRRDEQGDVIAFNSICPHLGCAVDYRQSNRDFFCPCHTSTFDLSGDRVNKIPPRGMDPLKIKLNQQTGEIWLKYENFRAGTEERVTV